jgi:hypothetical protein
MAGLKINKAPDTDNITEEKIEAENENLRS